MKKIILFFMLFYLTFNLFSNSKVIPPTFFGLHMHKVLKGNKPWPSVPFKTWRLWDTGICWPEIQPKEGEWRFELIDKAVKLAEEHNVEIVLNIGLSPKWASARPKDRSGYGENLTAAEPKNIETWKNYVRRLAIRYKGKIKYWEIWNEPDMRLFFTGSIGEMVELVKEANLILKEIDPDNKIISPAVTGYLVLIPWLDRFLKQGGKEYIDIIGTHFYVWFKSDIPEKVIFTIKRIKSITKRNGIPDIPIWNTECGFLHKNISKEQAIGYIARLAIVQWYYGVERFMPYSWDNKVIINMVEKNYKRLNHIGIAYQEVQKWLIGSKVTNLEERNDKIWIAHLVTPNEKKAIIIWHSDEINPSKKINFKIPESWNVTGIRTLTGKGVKKIPDNKQIEVSVMPILLVQER